jgi:hypothetical protein
MGVNGYKLLEMANGNGGVKVRRVAGEKCDTWL